MRIVSWSCDGCGMALEVEPPHVTIERPGIAIDGTSAVRHFDVCMHCLERVGFAEEGELRDQPRHEPLLTAAEIEHMQRWSATRATTRE